MNEEAMELAQDWVRRELAYCILNGWAVEFHPLNDGANLQIQISKCGKHACRTIPIATDVLYEDLGSNEHTSRRYYGGISLCRNVIKKLLAI